MNFKDMVKVGQMDPYHQNHTILPMQNQPSISTNINATGHQATSNYVLQLDPNSGHFEIIDSSLASALPSSRTIELGLTPGGNCGENDEAVYKIRDEDFYIRGPLTDQTFSDLDPVMDMGDLFARNMIQPTLPQLQVQPPDLQQQIHVQNMQMPTLQFVQQNHHQPIQAQLQIQASQHQPQLNFALEEVGVSHVPIENYPIQTMIPAPTSSATTSGGSGQISSTIMSLVSSFMSPGATAVQVDNNIIIYNPSGQIIQIPLPSNQQVSQPISAPSSSGYQFQTIPTSSSTSAADLGGWLDFVPIPSASQTISSSSPGQQQYTTTSTSAMLQQQQYVSVPGDEQMNAYQISELPEQNSYYDMQNVDLLPPAQTTSIIGTSAPVTLTCSSTTEVQMTNDLHYSSNQDCPNMGADEVDSVGVISAEEVREFLEPPVQVPWVKEAGVTEEPSTEIKVVSPTSNTDIKPVEETISTSTNDSSIVTPSPITLPNPVPLPQEPATTAPINSEPVAKVPTKIILLQEIKKPAPLPPHLPLPHKSQSPSLDDFDIKIVSCKSLSQFQTPSKTDPPSESTTRRPPPPLIPCDVVKEVERAQEQANVGPRRRACSTNSIETESINKIQVQSEFMDHSSTRPEMIDACYFVKEKRKLPPVVVPRSSLVPNIPHLLSGYVDEDDELLIAFKSRTNPNHTDICQLCYKWFHSPVQLRKHMISAHIGKAYFHPCTKCGARFPARILRLRHEKLHKYDLTYRRIVYIRQPDLKSHFKKRFRPAPFSPWYKSHVKKICNLVETLPFSCFDCGLEFLSSDFLTSHYDRVHASQICGFCGISLPNENSLILHEEEVHGHYAIRNNYVGGAWNLWDRHWMCEETVKRDVMVSNIAYFHNYTPLPDTGSKPYEEEFIERPMQFEDGDITWLEKDQDIPSPSELGSSFSASFDDDCLESSAIRLPFACDQCSKSYDNEFDLKRHARCHGNSSKPNLACQYCGRVFKTHSHKKEHERTHTGEKPYVCPICQRSFIQSSNLKKHLQTHQQTSLQCETCGKQFIKEASLILHQRAHAQDRKFRCAICDRAYNYASLLKRHMRIHTGEMPYSCESCGMLFHELVSLHYHRKKIHTGERPHKCDTCGRAFILSSDLKKHVQIHLKPPSDRPILKPMRKRSQSKSLDNRSSSENLLHLDTPLSSPNSNSTRITSYIAFPSSNPSEHLQIVEEESSNDLENEGEDNDEEQEGEGTPSILSPSPCSSLENEVVVASKPPPIVRVYARRDPSKSGLMNTNSAIRIDPAKMRIVNPSISIGTEEPMEVDDQSTTPKPQPVPTQSIFPQASRGNVISTHHSLTSEEDAALLLAMNQTDFQPVTSEVFSTPTTQEEMTSLEIDPTNPKSIQNVFGINQFNQFLTNITDVPEASSEIEIILDDKN